MGEHNKFNLPVKYSKLTPRERRLVREQYIKQQEGNCYYCHATLGEPSPPQVREKCVNAKLYPETFFKYPVHLHHDHGTDMTIGAVHCYCNAVLWEHHGE